MSIASTIYNAGVSTNKAFSEQIIGKYGSLINGLRSAHNITRFIKETPEYVHQFLQWLPERFQDYVPDFSSFANIAPYDAFLGKFKDYLTFVELPVKIQNLFDEIKNRGSKVKIASCAIQVGQKAIESTLLANSWNLINLAQYSFINVGALSTVKEFCVLVSSSLNVISFTKEIKSHSEVLNKKQARVTANGNVVAAIANARNNAGNNEHLITLNAALANYVNNPNRMHNREKLQQLEINLNQNTNQLAALITQLQQNQNNVQQASILNEDIRKKEIELNAIKEKYISRFFLDEIIGINSGLGGAIPLPNNAPAPVTTEINQIIADNNSDPLDVLDKIFLYKKIKTERQITNEQTEIRKSTIGRRFDIAKVAIVALGLCIALPFLAYAAAGIGIGLAVLQLSAWIVTLAVGILGMWKTINAAYYSEKVPMPPRLLHAQ